jgi:hypothetical protein
LTAPDNGPQAWTPGGAVKATFWEEVYDDPLVQAQEDELSLRWHVLVEYIALEDGERGKAGKE